MRVKDLMTNTPSICRIDESANEAARIMWDHDCGAVPVVDHDGRLAGIVTDRDICMAAYFHGAPLGSIAVADVMSRDICTCEAHEELAAAEQRMRDRQVRRLPVVDGDHVLTGILSLSDVTKGVTRPSGHPRGSDIVELLQTVAAISTPRVTARADEARSGR